MGLVNFIRGGEMKSILILLVVSSCVTVVKCESLSAKKQEYLALYARGDISFEEYRDLVRDDNIINKLR